MMSSRYIPNTFTSLHTLGNTESLLKASMEEIIKNSPPTGLYRHDLLSGLWHGPTGLAYLFLHVSSVHPDLRISNHRAITWAHSYIQGHRQHVHLESRHCGLASEQLAFAAVRAAVTKDLSHVREFVANIPAILEGESYPNEMLYGRAGTLYLLRMIRYWVPDSTPIVELPILQISQKIISEGPDWKWHDKRYLGAVHGDIGIITQLVLTTPTLASQLAPKLISLLETQLANGNWPSSEGKEATSLTQFCHGAPGFVLSLSSLKPFFPAIRDRIDAAVRKGRGCIWREGLLRKEPSLCHGIFSNALALPAGPHREHFLAFATPEKMAEYIKYDRSMFEPADYGSRYSLTAGYSPSAAWTWMMRSRESPKLVAYNDV
ncbi:hypothetical protein MKZ38_003355 [Zalerion maritima]|uniref:Abscisic acid ABA receptor n=1 Tax=Zalerion maritima TaxID=339359 RepID=A0AAD5RPA7_9PEZI|nr:hypothetical protein MKZ38_003355 [Zalerion maritima]